MTCLLDAAIECVRNSARTTGTTKMFQDVILGTSNMQDYGKIEFPGNFELFGKEERLPLPICIVHVVVKTYFTDCNGITGLKRRP